MAFLAITAGLSSAFAEAPGARHVVVSSTMQVSSQSQTLGEIFLGGNFLELGINPGGSFGTHNGSLPTGFVGSNRSQIGMVTDLDGFGVGTTQSFDYFMPGAPYVGWMAGYKVGGTQTTGKNTNDSSNAITRNMPTTVSDTSAADHLAATAVSSLGVLQVTQVVEFGVDDKFFKITVTLTNTGGSAIDSARYLWIVDPDNVQDLMPDDPFGEMGMDGYTTKNTIVHTIAAGDGKAVAEAATLESAPVQAKLVLYSTDSRARANFGYLSGIYGATAYDTTAVKGAISTNDEHMWMCWDAGTLAAGASTSFTMFVSMSNQSFAEMEAEIGGSTPNSAPTDIALTATSVTQSAGNDATVGSLSATDLDDTAFTFSLVTGTGDTDNALFNIEGSTLKIANGGTAAGAYSVRIRADDDGTDGTYEEVFAITVIDDLSPTIAAVAGPSARIYGEGEALELEFTFSESIDVGTADGTPALKLLIGGEEKTASYVSGTGTNKLVFRYLVQVGDYSADAHVGVDELTLHGGTIKDASGNNASLAFVAPDLPGVIVEADFHSGDIDRDWSLSLVELTRVIELYSTRDGATRTGEYHEQSVGEDGFAPGSGTLTSYHSADADHDGKISLIELTRVIELYNARQGDARTGIYHRAVGTEDGFTAGPRSLP